MTSAFRWGGWPAPRPGRFTPGKDPVLILQEAGWAPGPVWTGTENLAPTGFDSRIFQPVASRYTDWAIRPIRETFYKMFGRNHLQVMHILKIKKSLIVIGVFILYHWYYNHKKMKRFNILQSLRSGHLDEISPPKFCKHVSFSQFRAICAGGWSELTCTQLISLWTHRTQLGRTAEWLSSLTIAEAKRPQILEDDEAVIAVARWQVPEDTDWHRQRPAQVVPPCDKSGLRGTAVEQQYN